LSTNAAGPCDELSALIDRTYNFKPSKLSAEQQNTKAAEMDKVWNLVENGPKEMIPCLKTEIRARTADSFFRFNASNLVYKHDQSLESKHLLINAYAGVDLGDINLRYWLPYMAELGREGLDVSKPGETWIRFSNPLYYLPQHGTRPVDKGVGALALFGSMDESKATPVLSKLASEEGADFRSIVIWLLINQATPESDAEVKKLAAKLQKPLADRVLNEVANPQRIVPREGTEKTSRVVIIKALEDLLADKPGLWMKLVADVPDGERDMAKELTEKELTLLRKVRRMYAANATPHSPIWYSTFTQVINTIRLKAAGTSSVK
jgi:hypothetical protein